jgi:CMD domain protein
MSSVSPPDDSMDRLAGIAPGSALAALRSERADVVRHMQTSDDAVFRPATDAGFTRSERLAVALRIAGVLRDANLTAHYRSMLLDLKADGRLAASVEASAGPVDARWAAIVAHVDRVTADPNASRPEHVAALATVGLSPRAIVALSQLIAYVNYQVRVLAGLRMLGGRS